MQRTASSVAAAQTELHEAERGVKVAERLAAEKLDEGRLEEARRSLVGFGRWVQAGDVLGLASAVGAQEFTALVARSTEPSAAPGVR